MFYSLVGNYRQFSVLFVARWSGGTLDSRNGQRKCTSAFFANKTERDGVVSCMRSSSIILILAVLI